MNSRHDRDGLFSNIDVGKDLCCFRNSWQSLVKNGGIEMVEMKVDVIFLGTNASTLHYFHRFGSADHISGGQIKS